MILFYQVEKTRKQLFVDVLQNKFSFENNCAGVSFFKKAGHAQQLY